MKIALFGFFNDVRKELHGKRIGFFSDGESTGEHYIVMLLPENSANVPIGTIPKELYSKRFSRLCSSNAIAFVTLENLCITEDHAAVARPVLEHVAMLFCDHVPRQTSSAAEQRFLTEYRIGNGKKGMLGWGDAFGHFYWECLQPDE